MLIVEHGERPVEKMTKGRNLGTWYAGWGRKSQRTRRR